MYCAYCGTQLQDDQRYCISCGKPTGTVASATANAVPRTSVPLPSPVASAPQMLPISQTGFRQPCRLEQHLRILGVLWLVFSILRALPGLTLLGIGHLGFFHFGFPFGFPPHFSGFLGPILGSIGAFLTVTALAGI